MAEQSSDRNQKTEKGAVNVFFVALVAGLVIMVGVVYFIVRDRPNEDVVEGRERQVTSESAWTMEGMEEDLVLVEYQFEPQQARISGSVMNNSTFPFVRVEAEFELYDEQDEAIDQVMGFTSRVGPGQTWRFNIPVPPELTVSRVEPIALRGGQQAVTGSQRDPVYPRSDTVGAEDPANLRNPTVPRPERETDQD